MTGTVTISDDSGISNKDLITNDEKVKVNLTLTESLLLQRDEKLQVSADGGANWIKATGSRKTWTTTDNDVTLIEGVGKIIARIIDTAGNTSTLPLTNNSYTFDNVDPTAPSITYIEDDVGTTTGNIAKNGTTNDNTPTVRVSLTGTGADVGSTVKLYNGTDEIGTITLTAATVPAFIDIPTIVLVDGDYNIKAKVIDKAGNVSALSAEHTITVDNTLLDTFDGTNTLQGTSAADTLAATTTKTTVYGLSGDDIITGSTSNDTLVGGAGNDSLTGGSGADTFKYAFKYADKDTIADFDTTQGDKIDLADLLVGYETSKLAEFVTAKASGSDTVITVDYNGAADSTDTVEITLTNVAYSDTLLSSLVTNGDLIMS
ncbi:RTX toxins and related Ca2+-binding proteins [hydrothermal vent metagenome]|uniref:RTX toxins and related Ca2+-binding proteins n=1 Tax=hydrothermal vent metagenome TaxID=652676 RepID=A0A1W1E1M5_9ZZZZ